MSTKRSTRTGPTGWGRRARAWMALGGVVTVVGITGCDFKVSNPGPVADHILNDPESHPAVVAGVARALSDAWNQVWLETSAASREIMASGNLNISVLQGEGIFTPEESNGMWSAIMNARWLGDDAVRRLEENGGDPDLLAAAHVWAGFAYRLAGETLCNAVFDGGPAQPNSVYFDGAIDHFTAALGMTSDPTLLNAARAGRASVYVSKGDWANAAADAHPIPDDFTFKVLFSGEEPPQYNNVVFYSDNSPYRVHSVWHTPNEQYYLDTGDPRARWGQDPHYPYGEVQRPGIGNVPWYFQLKFTNYGDDVDLVSGREMRLIEAEALLHDGKWQEAMTLINALRTSQISDLTGEPLEPWPASSLDEAWTRLKRERGIELWLEARRLHDLRRWRDNNTPGALSPLEDENSGVETYLDPNRQLCVPIAKNEVDTNPNIGG